VLQLALSEHSFDLLLLVSFRDLDVCEIKYFGHDLKTVNPQIYTWLC